MSDIGESGARSASTACTKHRSMSPRCRGTTTASSRPAPSRSPGPVILRPSAAAQKRERNAKSGEQSSVTGQI